MNTFNKEFEIYSFTLCIEGAYLAGGGVGWGEQLLPLLYRRLDQSEFDQMKFLL